MLTEAIENRFINFTWKFSHKILAWVLIFLRKYCIIVLFILVIEVSAPKVSTSLASLESWSLIFAPGQIIASAWAMWVLVSYRKAISKFADQVCFYLSLSNLKNVLQSYLKV